jgi:hypothetical protein
MSTGNFQFINGLFTCLYHLLLLLLLKKGELLRSGYGIKI